MTETLTIMLAADGTPLKQKLARAERRQKIRAFLLVLPLFAFILITFVAPILDMLGRSVDNSIASDRIPLAAQALSDWDAGSGDLPSEETIAIFAGELKELAANRNHTQLGSRLNYEAPGYASLIRKTGRKIKRFDFDQPILPQLVKADKKWGNPETWAVLKQYSGAITAGYYRKALDLQLANDSNPNPGVMASTIGVEMLPDNEQIHLKLFGRTLIFSLLITGLCLVLAYPIAYLMAMLPLRTSNLLMILVLLPFWTSLLARTSAWKVLLQKNGVINETLVGLGILATDGRLELINNTTGTVVAMTHILLPFMILPLFSVMKPIPPSYVRAARSLGASEWTAFWRVYFPQTLPGIGAGGILVFILSIGYYITPELVGGRTGVFISNRIAYNILTSLNWGLAAALGALLLVGVLIVYWLYDRLVGIDNVKLG